MMDLTAAWQAISELELAPTAFVYVGSEEIGTFVDVVASRNEYGWGESRIISLVEDWEVSTTREAIELGEHLAKQLGLPLEIDI